MYLIKINFIRTAGCCNIGKNTRWSAFHDQGISSSCKTVLTETCVSGNIWHEWLSLVLTVIWDNDRTVISCSLLQCQEYQVTTHHHGHTCYHQQETLFQLFFIIHINMMQKWTFSSKTSLGISTSTSLSSSSKVLWRDVSVSVMLLMLLLSPRVSNLWQVTLWPTKHYQLINISIWL